MNTILKLRKEKDISQADMAKYLSISRPTYIEIEKDRKDLTLKEVFIIAKVFNVNVWKLIGDITGEMPEGELEPNISVFKDNVKELDKLLSEAKKIIQTL